MSSIPYSILQRIKSLFKMAKLVGSDDTVNLRKGWFSYEGKSDDNPQRGTLFSPYGHMYNPPAGSIVMLFSQNGQESNAVGIADDVKNRTLKSLSEGEVATGNYLTGSYVYFKENGDILVNSENNVQVVANGNVSVTATGNITSVSGGNITAQASGAFDVTATTSTFTIGGVTFTFNGSGISVVGGDVVVDGVSLKAHVHSGVTAGGANTGAPV